MSETRDNLNENSKYTVLIAEDEKITREGVEEFLKSKGFNVIAVANGEEVLDHFRDASLVLLDIMMPRLNGIETLRNIRQVSNVPVIMLTHVLRRIRLLSLPFPECLSSYFHPSLFLLCYEIGRLSATQIGRASCRKECRSRWSPYH